MSGDQRPQQQGEQTSRGEKPQACISFRSERRKGEGPRPSYISYVRALGREGSHRVSTAKSEAVSLLLNVTPAWGTRVYAGVPHLAVLLTPDGALPGLS